MIRCHGTRVDIVLLLKWIILILFVLFVAENDEIPAMKIAQVSTKLKFLSIITSGIYVFYSNQIDLHTILSSGERRNDGNLEYTFAPSQSQTGRYVVGG